MEPEWSRMQNIAEIQVTLNPKQNKIRYCSALKRETYYYYRQKLLEPTEKTERKELSC